MFFSGETAHKWIGTNPASSMESTDVEIVWKPPIAQTAVGKAGWPSRWGTTTSAADKATDERNQVWDQRKSFLVYTQTLHDYQKQGGLSARHSSRQGIRQFNDSRERHRDCSLLRRLARCAHPRCGRNEEVEKEEEEGKGEDGGGRGGGSEGGREIEKESSSPLKDSLQ